MLIPVEWLREYVKFDASPQELAERLTMAGLEVEDIRPSAIGEVFSTYVTPNRPDLLSVTGVARDVSALLNIPLELPKAGVEEGEVKAADLMKLDIESPINCPRYSARIITGVNIVESPVWMKERLTAAGMRPINNIVDSTNYVLLELGQPLHAFDYDLIADHHIIVRQARPGEKITSIDGEERALTPDMLVIADADKAVAIAGVMGGIDSEVGSNTKNVLLESAHFNRLSIRRTARSLQMSTESSYRFERGVDPQLTVYALDRVAELIKETGGGTVAKDIVDAYPVKAQPLCITIRPQRTSMILGYSVNSKQIADYLTRLGMKVTSVKDKSLEVVVPTFRPDITREVDLIEEVGRVHGYELIPERLPVGETLQGHDSPEGEFASKISQVLTSCGLQELITGSMTSTIENERQVTIRNPLSDDLSCLRNNLLLDLLEVVSYNGTRGIRDIACFEIGRVFIPQNDDNVLVEKHSIGAVITGSMWELTWNVDRSSLGADFFQIKGIVENLLEKLGVQDVIFKPAEIRYFHPTRAAILEAKGERLGVLGQIAGDTAEHYKVPTGTFAFEIDFDLLLETSCEYSLYRPLSRYPAVMRDLAVVVGGDVTHQRVEEIIELAGEDLLENITLFDVYKGAPLPPDKSSLAFNIIFRSRERTLHDEEADTCLNKIKSMLAKELGATFRET